jgi:hypothetical protein
MGSAWFAGRDDSVESFAKGFSLGAGVEAGLRQQGGMRGLHTFRKPAPSEESLADGFRDGLKG